MREKRRERESPRRSVSVWEWRERRCVYVCVREGRREREKHLFGVAKWQVYVSVHTRVCVCV